MTRLPLVLVVVAACGAPAGTAPDTTTAVVALDTITAPAEVTVEAARATTAPIVVAVAPPPLPDPCALEQYVNELPYRWMDPAPVVESYRIVAACLGWNWATMDFYQPGVIDDLIPKESGFCPYTQRGQQVTDDCRPYGSAEGDDTGLMQITSSAHGVDGVLCRDHGYCGSGSIKQSAWHSMRSGLILIMRSGKFPWTWDSRACRFHSLVCSTWPKAWSNL